MKIIILCVWVFCLHACLHTTYLSGAHRRQQKASDSWELELQVFGSHHVGAGNQAQGLCKSSSALHTGPLQPSSLCGGPVSPLGLFIAEGLPKARPLKTKSLATLQLLHFCLFNCIRALGLYCGLLVHYGPHRTQAPPSSCLSPGALKFRHRASSWSLSLIFLSLSVVDFL